MVEQISVEDPIKSKHDLRTTRASIKQLLANGTPNWVRFPEDYRAFAQEAILEEQDISREMAKAYQMEDQDILTNEKARKVNIITTRDFIKKLRDNGIRCFTVDNGFPRGTVALWAIRPGGDEAIYICYLQIPAMYEWSVLRLDKRGLPNGESYRGWRTVMVQLVEKEILTEAKAHEIFGRPTDGVTSRRYRRSLFEFRNRKRLKTGGI